MRDGEPSAIGPPASNRPVGYLLVLAILSTAAYGAVAMLSFRFAPDAPVSERPILAVLGLLGSAFVCYLLALAIALRSAETRWLLAIIVTASVLFRAVSLVSWPILEIDVYRYLWDGEVVWQGVSPYRYSPEQVLSGSSDGELPGEYRRLLALRDSNSAVQTILSRVHYGHLPTIYPPVSQVAFAGAVALMPPRAGVLQRIVTIKAVFVAFDLTTLAIVIGLLRCAGLHLGWSIAYGWCPLAIKEIANTGHLDSVTVFLTTLAIYWAVQSLRRDDRSRQRRHALLSAVGLALAIGAKLYPIVLLPWFAAVWLRGNGWRWALLSIAVWMALTAIVVFPMVPTDRVLAAIGVESAGTVPREPVTELSVETATSQPQDPSTGLTMFLRHWQMNDFLCMLVTENLRPISDMPSDQTAWFSVLPPTWRDRLLAVPMRWTGADPSGAAFLTMRFLTLSVFAVIAVSVLWPLRRSQDPAAWLRAAFLTLAWFWLLSPTQNPWYWIWALPLVMFAGNRAWLAISGLVMIYYLRFWFVHHWADHSVLGTGYSGALFFDFVVAWLEFGPWFLWLAWETAVARPPESKNSTAIV
jgi:hypothetical protein